MHKVWGFLGFVGMLAVGTVVLAYAVRNYAPVSVKNLFSFA